MTREADASLERSQGWTVNQELWTAVDQYISDVLIRADPVLDASIEASVAAGLPQIQRRILEIGTLAGYSTIWLARALPADGRVVTLESEPPHAEVARSNFERAGLSGMIDLRVGAALDTLP